MITDPEAIEKAIKIWCAKFTAYDIDQVRALYADPKTAVELYVKENIDRDAAIIAEPTPNQEPSSVNTIVKALQNHVDSCLTACHATDIITNFDFDKCREGLTLLVKLHLRPMGVTDGQH